MSGAAGQKRVSSRFLKEPPPKSFSGTSSPYGTVLHFKLETAELVT
jgi:hypothetical protein